MLAGKTKRTCAAEEMVDAVCAAMVDYRSLMLVLVAAAGWPSASEAKGMLGAHAL
jgi:hypothetical protein